MQVKDGLATEGLHFLATGMAWSFAAAGTGGEDRGEAAALDSKGGQGEAAALDSKGGQGEAAALNSKGCLLEFE